MTERIPDPDWTHGPSEPEPEDVWEPDPDAESDRRREGKEDDER